MADAERPAPVPFSLRKFAKNTSYLFLGGSATSVLAFIQSILIVRVLGANDYGAWAVITSFVGMAPAFLGFKTSLPLTREVVRMREAASRSGLSLLLASALWVEVITNLAALLLVGGASTLVATHAAKAPSLWPIAWIYGSRLLLQAVEPIWFSVARDRQAYRALSAVPTIGALALFGAVIVLWRLESLNLWSLAWAHLASSLLLCLLETVHLEMLLRRAYGLRLSRLAYGGLWSRRREIAEFWEFMWSTYARSLIGSVLKSCDVVVLGWFRAPAEAGIYKLAKSMASVLTLLVDPLTKSFYQDVNEQLHTGQYRQMQRDLDRMTRKAALPTAVVIVAAVALAKPAVLLLYGADFAPAATYFSIIMIGSAFSLLLFWAPPLIQACGEHMYQLQVTLWVGLPSLAFMVVGSYLWGATGLAALSTFRAIVPHLLFRRRGLTRLEALAAEAELPPAASR
ncbi:MAG: lipopolysaccharide biosynthesis protein [Armatimonadetes bacterium]|nr:lipopolysaccharide biosynthesis protein [Armatimonadota bacterium]